MWKWENRNDSSKLKIKNGALITLFLQNAKVSDHMLYGDNEALKRILMVLMQKEVTAEFTQKNVQEYVKGLNSKAIDLINTHLSSIKAGFTVVGTSSIECSVNLPDLLKKPDPKTGKVFNLLSPESIAAYKTLNKFKVEEKVGHCLLTSLEKGREKDVITVHPYKMTIDEPNTKNLEEMVMAMDAAFKASNITPKEVWVDGDEESIKILTKLYTDKGFKIVDKPKEPDIVPTSIKFNM